MKLILAALVTVLGSGDLAPKPDAHCLTADVLQEQWTEMAAKTDHGTIDVIATDKAQSFADLTSIMWGRNTAQVANVMVYVAGDRSAAAVYFGKDGCAFLVSVLKKGEYDGMLRLMHSTWPH